MRLTFLKVLIDENLKLILYNAPVRNLGWFIETGWGLRIERLESEFIRINNYYKLGHIANYDQAIEYQKWKETLI